MDKASLAQWLNRLETLHPNPIDLGLERVARVAGALELLPAAAPAITVAGTNGKGSTVAMLEAILEQCGLTAGVYTSPHLLRFNERIRVAGAEVDDGEITAAFAAIERARGVTSLTYFEFATLAALWIFRARKVDVMVLEVGLGGRLDAVNIVDPAVAVITRIDLDHQDWLGDDRASIAREKAGILRRETPVVIGDPEPPAALLACVEAVGAAPLLRLGQEFSCVVEGGEWRGVLREPDGSMRLLPARPRGALIPANICTALQAARQFGCDFSDRQLDQALDRARPQGRCERHAVAGREYVLDVAHNPGAVHNLVEYLSLTYCKGETYCIFSAMKDKDIRGMIRAAAPAIDHWYVADQPANPRAAGAAAIAVLLEEAGRRSVVTSGSLEQALDEARTAMRDGDRLVVFGSFFTVAAILEPLQQWFQREQSRAGTGS